METVLTHPRYRTELAAPQQSARGRCIGPRHAAGPIGAAELAQRDLLPEFFRHPLP